LAPAHTPNKVRIGFDNVGHMTIGETHEPGEGDCVALRILLGLRRSDT
jgi:hypothetical protein